MLVGRTAGIAILVTYRERYYADCVSNAGNGVTARIFLAGATGVIGRTLVPLFRVPEEGPCECDLYLTCAKFVTTPEYAPRLRERRIREITLADEALAKGFHREAERQDCARKRIEELLRDLGEPAAMTVD